MTFKNFNKVEKALAKLFTILAAFTFGAMVDNTIEYTTTEGIIISVFLGITLIIAIGIEHLMKKYSKES